MAKAVIVGASGLIGSELVEILLQSIAYQNVTILVRKELPLDHPKLKQVVVDFDRLTSIGLTAFCLSSRYRHFSP